MDYKTQSVFIRLCARNITSVACSCKCRSHRIWHNVIIQFDCCTQKCQPFNSLRNVTRKIDTVFQPYNRLSTARFLYVAGKRFALERLKLYFQVKVKWVYLFIYSFIERRSNNQRYKRYGETIIDSCYCRKYYWQPPPLQSVNINKYWFLTRYWRSAVR